MVQFENCATIPLSKGWSSPVRSRRMGVIPQPFMNRVLTGLFLFYLALTLLAVQATTEKAAAQAASAKDGQPSGPATQTGPGQPPAPPDYSQEPYVVEHYRQAMRYETDGTGREQTAAQIRVVSESGVQALGQLKFGYSALCDKLDIVYVRVRKPDGTVVTP